MTDSLFKRISGIIFIILAFVRLLNIGPGTNFLVLIVHIAIYIATGVAILMWNTKVLSIALIVNILNSVFGIVNAVVGLKQYGFSFMDVLSSYSSSLFLIISFVLLLLQLNQKYIPGLVVIAIAVAGGLFPIIFQGRFSLYRFVFAVLYIAAFVTLELEVGKTVAEKNAEDRVEAYKKQVELADYVHDLYKDAPQKIKNNQSVDPTEELRKYKELLDAGAITQEEFDTKKCKLLGL